MVNIKILTILFITIASTSRLIQAKSINSRKEKIIDLGIQLLDEYDNNVPLSRNSRDTERQSLLELNDAILDMVMEDIIEEVEAELSGTVDFKQEDKNSLDKKIEALAAILALDIAKSEAAPLSNNPRYKRNGRSSSKTGSSPSTNKQRSTNNQKNLTNLSMKMRVQRSRIEFLKQLRNRRRGRYRVVMDICFRIKGRPHEKTIMG